MLIFFEAYWRESPARGLEGNPTFLEPLREIVGTCSVSKATSRSFLACVAERGWGAGRGMLSVWSRRLFGLSGAGLAVFNRRMEPVPSCGTGVAAREPFSVAVGLKGSSFEVRGGVAERSGSGNVGTSLPAKRSCGGRGGRAGAVRIEPEESEVEGRLSGGATTKEEAETSAPLYSLETDIWSSDWFILAEARSGSTEVLLSWRRRIEGIGRSAGGVSLRSGVVAPSMPGLASSPKRTRGPVEDLVVTGARAAIVISGFESCIIEGGEDAEDASELPSSVDDDFFFRRQQNQKITASKSKTTPPITPPSMTFIVGPLGATAGLVVLVLLGSYLE